MLIKWWAWIKMMRQDLIILFFAWRNPATPRYIKTMIWLALGYLVSPIDFIPDYLPVLGMVDDLTLVPAVLYCVGRLVPPAVYSEAKRQAQTAERRLPYVLALIAVILIVWVGLLGWGIYTLLQG